MSNPDTSHEAYREILANGDDVKLRRRVAAKLGQRSMTIKELVKAFPSRTANSIRPRVNELVRMRCVERDGKRLNPSGRDAYVHHLTDRGEQYVRGEVTPRIEPSLAEYKRNVVDAAREFVNGDGDPTDLAVEVKAHDDAKRRVDPDWEPDTGGDATE